MNEIISMSIRVSEEEFNQVIIENLNNEFKD